MEEWDLLASLLLPLSELATAPWADGQYPSTSGPVSLSLSHYGSGQTTNCYCTQRLKEQRVLLGCSVWCPALVSYFFNASPSVCSFF